MLGRHHDVQGAQRRPQLIGQRRAGQPDPRPELADVDAAEPLAEHVDRARRRDAGSSDAMRSSVVLPEPLRPSTTQRSPGAHRPSRCRRGGTGRRATTPHAAQRAATPSPGIGGSRARRSGSRGGAGAPEAPARPHHVADVAGAGRPGSRPRPSTPPARRSRRRVGDVHGHVAARRAPARPSSSAGCSSGSGTGGCSTTANTTGRCSWAAVHSACGEYMAEPSPTTHRTGTAPS